MNSTDSSTVAAITAELIQEAHQSYIYNSVLFSVTTLTFYTTLTSFSREKEYIWSRPFSLPTLLYIFARYGNVMEQGLTVSLTFLPLGRACNILADISNVISLFPYTGIQGLLVVRAYSMCKGNKILGSTLAFGIFAYLGLSTYGIVAYPGCALSQNVQGNISTHVCDIINIFIDVLVFGICMWKVWGIWKLRGDNGIQRNNSLISILLTQSISRFCFVITITVAGVVMVLVNTTPPSLASSYNFMQEVSLSAILIADFTLDLRYLNSSKIEASQMSLPPLRFSNILQHVHQSILVEMTTPEERNVEEEVGNNNHDHLSESIDSNIQLTEV